MRIEGMFVSEAEIRDLVDRWCDCSLPEKEWTHAAHVATCGYVAWSHTLQETYDFMKAGLYRFNEATNTPNTDERGYHETLTRFWCALLFHEIRSGGFESCLDGVNAMVARYRGNSRAEQSYYSFNVLRSKDARKAWIAPDMQGGIRLEAFEW